MRSFIDIVTKPLLTEKVIADYQNPFDPSVNYEIFKNGSRRELGKLMSRVHPHNTTKDIRAILDPSGDLYFFDGWASAHAGIKAFLNLHRDGLHLNLFADHVGVGWGRRSPTREQFDAAVSIVQENRYIQDLYGRDVKVEPMVDIIKPSHPPKYRDY